jgi:hypothetical protein
MAQRGRGNHFVPTEKQRGQVESMTAYGIPAAEIARSLDISEPTLRKAFPEEIATGASKANTKVAEFLYATIMGMEIPGRPPVTGDAQRMAAMIFWLKSRAHWKETSVHQYQELPPDENAARKALNDKLAKLAFRRSKKPDTEPTN